MIFPKRLQAGDTVGVIAPASPVNEEQLNKAIPFLTQLGLRVKLGKHVFAEHGYLAGADEQRLEDFHTMFEDPEVKAIFCARGGYGSARFAANIDYELIRRNPKVFWGYSDITFLHTAIHQHTNLITFHGPMLDSDVSKPHFDSFSASMFQQLFTPSKLFYTNEISLLKVIKPGCATGKLVGGNLSLIVSTLGTPFEIDTKGALLLIEDIDEVPYRVDGMLNQLALANKLQDAAGLVIGDFHNAEPKKQPSLSLEEVFHHYATCVSGPIVSGFSIGHCIPHFSVPLGGEATLDATTKTLTIQPGVK